MITFPNFTLAEFLDSETARRKRIDNFPTFQVVENLVELTSTILQPLRTAWGSGININSGYRCEELNKAVGGSATSVHRLGLAADLYPVNGKYAEFVLFAQDFLRRNGIGFDQCIVETAGRDQWLHIGLRNNAGQQRRLFMSIDK